MKQEDAGFYIYTFINLFFIVGMSTVSYSESDSVAAVIVGGTFFQLFLHGMFSLFDGQEV